MPVRLEAALPRAGRPTLKRAGRMPDGGATAPLPVGTNTGYKGTLCDRPGRTEAGARAIGLRRIQQFCHPTLACRSPASD